MRRKIHIGENEGDVGDGYFYEDGFGVVVDKRRWAFDVFDEVMDERDKTTTATGRPITPDD